MTTKGLDQMLEGKVKSWYFVVFSMVSRDVCSKKKKQKKKKEGFLPDKKTERDVGEDLKFFYFFFGCQIYRTKVIVLCVQSTSTMTSYNDYQKVAINFY